MLSAGGSLRHGQCMKDGTDVADKASAAALLPQIQAEVMA